MVKVTDDEDLTQTVQCKWKGDRYKSGQGAGTTGE